MDFYPSAARSALVLAHVCGRHGLCCLTSGLKTGSVSGSPIF
jgi:hypothetical protein